MRLVKRILAIIGLPLVCGALPFAWAYYFGRINIFKEIHCGIAAAADGACMGIDDAAGRTFLAVVVGLIIIGLIGGFLISRFLITRTESIWDYEIRLSPKTQRYILGILGLVLIFIIFSPYLHKKLWQQPLWNRFILANTTPPSMLRDRAIIRLSNSATAADAAFITNLIERGPEAERYRWIVALARIRGHTSCDVFLKLAHEQDSSIRYTAFQYLLDCSNNELGALFIEGLNDTDRKIQVLSVSGLGHIREKNLLAPMIDRFRKFEAPDVLSRFETHLGQTISTISGKHFDFSQKCCTVKGIWPQGPEEIPFKRTCCDNKGPVKARAELLRSLDK